MYGVKNETMFHAQVRVNDKTKTYRIVFTFDDFEPPLEWTTSKDALLAILDAIKDAEAQGYSDLP